MTVVVSLVALAFGTLSLAHAQASDSASASSFPNIMSGINALVGSTLDPRAAKATTSGLGSLVGRLQKGVKAAPAASASAAAAGSSGVSTSATALGFQQLLGSLGSSIPASVATSAAPADPLAELIKGFSMPKVEAGSLSLNLIDLDLSSIYAALHPTNFPYCTPPVFTPASLSPAVILAPATKITIKTGSCAVNTTSSGEQLLTCTAPETVYEQTPLTVVQPGYTAATFTDTSCIIAKQLTESSREILYSGGADVTYGTIEEWLASFQAPATVPLGLGSTAEFMPISIPVAKAPIVDTTPVLDPITPGASANATSSGKDSSADVTVTGR